MASKKATPATQGTNLPATEADLKAQVPSMIESLQKQLKELEGETDETVSLDIKYDNRNIKDITSVSELLMISSSLRSREKAFNEEVKRYDLQEVVKPFSQSDKTVAYWDKVITKAIKELVNKEKIALLKESIKKLSKHLDEKTKLERELNEIMELASKKLS